MDWLKCEEGGYNIKNVFKGYRDVPNSIGGGTITLFV